MQPNDDLTQPAAIGDDPEPVLAGTLCLMSCFPANHHAGIAHKIIHNLGVLARHPGCSAAMRQVCWQAREHWVAEMFRHRQAGVAAGHPSTATALATASATEAATALTASDDTPLMSASSTASGRRLH